MRRRRRVGIAVVLWRSGQARHRGWAAPYVGSVSWLPQARPELAERTAPSGVRLASTEATSPQTTPSAQAGPQGIVSPTAALMPAEMAQLLQTMARDLATVQQGIEQLKVNQEQLASDNAKAVEQFKASQEQMTRLVARVSEQEQRARLPAPPPPADSGAGAQARACAPGVVPSQGAADAVAARRSSAQGGIATLPKPPYVRCRRHSGAPLGASPESITTGRCRLERSLASLPDNDRHGVCILGSR